MFLVKNFIFLPLPTQPICATLWHQHYFSHYIFHYTPYNFFRWHSLVEVNQTIVSLVSLRICFLIFLMSSTGRSLMDLKWSEASEPSVWVLRRTILNVSLSENKMKCILKMLRVKAAKSVGFWKTYLGVKKRYFWKSNLFHKAKNVTYVTFCIRQKTLGTFQLSTSTSTTTTTTSTSITTTHQHPQQQQQYFDMVGINYFHNNQFMHHNTTTTSPSTTTITTTSKPTATTTRPLQQQ